MDARLTVSLLAADGSVVAWGFVNAAPRGDGALWATEPLAAVVEREAPITTRVVHWPDLHVGQQTAWTLDAQPVGMGIQVRFPDPLLQFATPDFPLPCVTVRGDAVVAPGSGRLGVM